MSRPNDDLGTLFRDHWRRHFALPPGNAVVVAVSGGIDSMALLALLVRDGAGGDGLEIVAAHFDHRTRGAESAEDGRFVEAVAGRWRARVIRGRGNAPAEAAASGRGPQAAARNLRYAFLRRVVERTDAAALVTAHQRDDLVETVLLRIVRGTSPDGLGALTPIDEVGGLPLLRPLLPFSRAAIAAWVEATGVPFREDPSNRQARYPRTRVRHDLRPLLEELNPRVDAAVVRLSAQAAADAAYLRSAALDLLDTATMKRTSQLWRLDAEGLVSAPSPVLSRAVLEGWAWGAPAGMSPPGAEWVEGAMEFLRGGRGGRVACPGGGTLRRLRGTVEFHRARAGDRGREARDA